MNKGKGNVLIFNTEQQPDTIENIKVVDILEKAKKMANLTYCIIEKSCNKLLIGNTYGKSIILPSILYGTNIINLSEDDIKDLQIMCTDQY